ncbi:hypothetical protein EON66_06895 [archaeon]|nr:MAG: hypothetical protein EON66_06895 [archaeon]
MAIIREELSASWTALRCSQSAVSVPSGHVLRSWTFGESGGASDFCSEVRLQAMVPLHANPEHMRGFFSFPCHTQAFVLRHDVFHCSMAAQTRARG